MAESPLFAKELNDQLLYTCYAVLQRATPLPADRSAIADEAQVLLDEVLEKDVYTRGTYDLAGFKAEADLMVWWTCPDVDVLQDAVARFRRTGLGERLDAV